MSALLSTILTSLLLLLLSANIAQAAPTAYERGDLSATDLAWLDVVGAVDILMMSKRQEDSSSGYKNDPAAGSYVDKGAIAAIVAGCVGVLLLVGVLIFCGRAGRWPRKSGGGSKTGGK